jgi:formate dehydrogenase iron-sulfur subunit
MCHERQIKGEQTACSEACPVGATITGDRNALIAEAQKRIAEKPDQYYNRIYGVKEVGGTSVLFLSAVPFDKIGLRTNMPEQGLPQLTWDVLSHIPDVVSMGSVLLGGVYWLRHRKDEVEAAEGPYRPAKSGKENAR